MTLKKSKGNENVLKPNEELVHVDLHSSKKSNMDGDSLWVLLLNNQSNRGKYGKQTFECLEVDKAFEARKEEVKPFLTAFESSWCNKARS
jgi:hypothetical protein